MTASLGIARVFGVAVLLLLQGCGGIDDQTAIDQTVEQQRKWQSQRARNYNYVLERYGMLSGGEIHIEVRGGRLAKAKQSDGSVIGDITLLSQLPVIDDLFDELESDLRGNKGRCKTKTLDFSEIYYPAEFKMTCGVETIGFRVSDYRRL